VGGSKAPNQNVFCTAGSGENTSKKSPFILLVKGIKAGLTSLAFFYGDSPARMQSSVKKDAFKPVLIDSWFSVTIRGSAKKMALFMTKTRIFFLDSNGNCNYPGNFFLLHLFTPFLISAFSPLTINGLETKGGFDAPIFALYFIGIESADHLYKS
jgi:hypothetical protein